MPRIVAHIKEMLEEEKYGTEFISKLPDRLRELDVPHLLMMHDYIESVEERCRLPLWAKANNQLMTKVTQLLSEESENYEREKRRHLEVALRKERMQQLEEAKQREFERVMENIREKSRQMAEEEIMEQERKRQMQERINMAKKTFEGEKKRWRLFFLGIFILIAVAVPIIIFVKQLTYLIIALFCDGCLSAFIFWRAYTAGLLSQDSIIPAEKLEHNIRVRAEDLRLKAMNELKEKERLYQEELDREKEEKRARKKARKEAKLLNAAVSRISTGVDSDSYKTNSYREQYELLEDGMIGDENIESVYAHHSSKNGQFNQENPSITNRSDFATEDIEKYETENRYADYMMKTAAILDEIMKEKENEVHEFDDIL
jgi:hypothetical protein